ncbi:glycan-binding surface protein [Labilibacter marinus]|uniref:glycan-binding surface protein n=1 Tax=Labilibacter marinus TaxID=1477105 RepID=UPI00094FA643|nr:glycan-binding surface protein [Labilibacter marinus]
MQTTYIKHFKTYLLLCLIGMVGLGSLLTSCEKDEKNGTNEVTLYSYGPMPIARGAELQFIGENLDKVTSIIIPPSIEIISSEFTAQDKKGIMLTVPQEAVEGYVELLAGETSITTKTEIGFSEPISIASFTPQSIKPGAVLTIDGDYLNLVGEVIFTDRVAIDSSMFITKSRKQLTLEVPAEAQTGKIAVSNGADEPIIIYSETDLSVTIPTLTAIAPNPVKASSDLTITGTDLDLVTSITFGGDLEVEEFEEDGSTIVVEVPESAMDGKVMLNLASGLMVTSSDDLVMVVPTLSVSPTTIKNGGTLTVTGENLDLISEVQFAGEAMGTIEAGGSATEIMVTVPDAALTGEVVFKTKASKSVSGGELTLVNPVITSFAPSSAKPNTDVVISGTDLDLVKKVIFAGDIEGAIISKLETDLTVTIPVGAITGAIKLIAINGTEVMSSGELEVLQNLPNFISFSESKGVPGKILTLNGTKMDLIKELIFPGNYTATAYGEKNDSKVEVYVPEDVPVGFGQISMITYEGEEGLLPELFFGGIDPVENETLVFFDFNGTGSKDSWWGNAIGSGILVDEANSADGSSFWNVDGMSGDGNWDGLFFRNGSNNFVTDGVDVSRDVYKFDVNIREAINEGALKIRMGNSSDDGGDGYWYEWKPWAGNADGYKTEGWISVEIPLSEFKDGSGNVMPSADKGGTEFGMIWASGVSVKVNMGIDNVRFEIK